APAETGLLVRPDLVALCRLAWPELPVNDAGWLSDEARGDVVLVNARWLAPAGPLRPEFPSVGLAGGQVAYVALPAAGAGVGAPRSGRRTWAAGCGSGARRCRGMSRGAR